MRQSVIKKNTSFAASLSGACRGIKYSLKTESHMRFHFFISLLVVISGFVFHLSGIQWLFVTYAISSVLVAELFNTALERTVDLAKPNLDPLAGMAKDIAAGAVLITTIQAVIVGSVIFGSYIF